MLLLTAAVALRHGPARAGESIEFDAVRGSLGAGAVVSTLDFGESPASFDVYAAVETGWRVHHVGFWSGLSVLFPSAIGFCVTPNADFCAPRVVDIQTGLDYSSDGVRVGGWVGIGGSFLPSVGIRAEWLPIRVGSVGRTGGSLKVAALSFPPVTSTIPAVEIDVGVRFDLWPAEQSP
jgi:hypothetical protein